MRTVKRRKYLMNLPRSFWSRCYKANLLHQQGNKTTPALSAAMVLSRQIPKASIRI
jgi:hypothetical protein